MTGKIPFNSTDLLETNQRVAKIIANFLGRSQLTGVEVPQMMQATNWLAEILNGKLIVLDEKRIDSFEEVITSKDEALKTAEQEIRHLKNVLATAKETIIEYVHELDELKKSIKDGA